MSAIVAAMTAAREEYARTRNPEDAILLAWDLDDACKAIVRASNAAGAGRVVEGRPVRIRACSVDGCGGWVDGVGWHIKIPRKGWRPTWLGGAWVWSTAAHDPRPCAWPRPFARGTAP